MRQPHLTLLALVCLLYSFKEIDHQSQIIIKRINEYLADPARSTNRMQAFVESGSMDGLFKTNEVLNVFDHLHETYPRFVSKEKIGQSFLKKDLFAYKLTAATTDEQRNAKRSSILFTGAHHARELLTPTIILKIYVEALHSLIYPRTELKFWRYNDLLIIPIVNIDSHQFISDSYDTEGWDRSKEKRKNMRDTC